MLVRVALLALINVAVAPILLIAPPAMLQISDICQERPAFAVSGTTMIFLTPNVDHATTLA